MNYWERKENNIKNCPNWSFFFLVNFIFLRKFSVPGIWFPISIFYGFYNVFLDFCYRTCYNANPRPDALMKEQLVEMTGLSPRVIRVWFQNKRCKDKKKTIQMKLQMQQEKVSVNASWNLFNYVFNVIISFWKKVRLWSVSIL